MKIYRGLVLGAVAGICAAMIPGDARSQLAEAFTVEAAYTGEVWTNAAGGLNQGTGYLDNYDLALSIDAEAAWGWTGANFFFYMLGNTDSTLSERFIGDIQTVSNIDTDGAVKLYEAWYEQELFGGGMAIKFGLYDLNSEFDAKEVGSLFINSSHGIGADFSQAGENGPSIFPSTSLSVRALVYLSQNWFIQVAALDGVPGDPDHPGRTAIKLGGGDGLLLVSELDYLNELGTKIGIGTWRFTSRFDDVYKMDEFGDPLSHKGNWGVYILAEAQLFGEPDDAAQGLSAYARFGIADKDVNQFDRFIGAGLVYTGLFPGREEDQLGIAIAIADNGKPYLAAERLNFMFAKEREYGFELTYSMTFLDRIMLQPDVQYIVNPSMDPAMGNAWVLGLRVQFSY